MLIWIEVCFLVSFIIQCRCETAELQESNSIPNPYCQEPPTTGRCKGKYLRWYFNKSKQKCLKFKYGGCDGNNNRFLSWGQCMLSCPQKKITNTDCLEPKIVGSCYSKLRRWHYNTITETCEAFHYSGCEGSKNRFISKNACRKNCPAKQGCWMPMKRGSCTNYALRYYFNAMKKQCEPFIYGGCQGNENNFPSKEDCKNTCPTEVRKGISYS